MYTYHLAKFWTMNFIEFFMKFQTQQACVKILLPGLFDLVIIFDIYNSPQKYSKYSGTS